MTDPQSTGANPVPDPADVAALSSAAAALLGTAGQLGAGLGGQAAGPLPPLPPAATLPSNSRYVGVGTALWVAPDGTEVTYLRRRQVPSPERLATAGWDTVPAGDRVDLLADRLLGEATGFWRLADANLAFDAAELEVPGRIVRVALPEGFPGGDDA